MGSSMHRILEKLKENVSDTRKWNRIIGKIFNFVIIFLLAQQILIVLFFQLPFDWKICSSITFLAFKYLLFAYFFCSFLFNFYQAKFAKPVKCRASPSDPTCLICGCLKGSETHHCSTCDTCIYKLDHHCVVLNCCVGAHNQAHFFLFNAFMSIGLAIFLALSYQFWFDVLKKFYEDVVKNSDEASYPFTFHPMIYLLSRTSKENALLCTSLMFFLLFLLVGGSISIYYGYLITNGTNFFLEKFYPTEKPQKLTWNLIVKRWKIYFDVDEKKSVWKTILLLSTSRVNKFSNET